MKSRAQFVAYLCVLAACLSGGLAQQPVNAQNPPERAAGAQAGATPQTETIPPPQPAQPSPPVTAPGYMDPAQVKALAHKIWQAELRANDLVTQLHPKKWVVSNIVRNSFNQTLENLQAALAGLEDWRAKFETRPDSMYFGFETFAEISAVLPRLDGVGRAANQFESASLGAEFSQAGGQFFDLQQALEPYIAYLLRSPDQALYVAQTNLAGCQSQLGNALRGQAGPATPLKNTFVEFHARRSDGHPNQRTSPQSEKKDSQKKSEKKAETPPSKTPSAH